MRTIGTFLGIVLLAVLMLTISSGLLVLMAYLSGLQKSDRKKGKR